jgi:hypothetical protein
MKALILTNKYARMLLSECSAVLFMAMGISVARKELCDESVDADLSICSCPTEHK